MLRLVSEGKLLFRYVDRFELVLKCSLCLPYLVSIVRLDEPVNAFGLFCTLFKLSYNFFPVSIVFRLLLGSDRELESL